ncbi:MAG: replication factor C small subunit [Candidatus Aenigmarchaeota archaeon]|nr:replication factor C small subunit [Candidatus Aenigmarchaeota archaeon]
MMEIWTEKYRPHKLEDIVGQEHIVKRLKAFVERKSIPNLLFAGMQGTGKTTAALCMVNELFRENSTSNFIELNASDERGIDTVRVKIKDFARTKPMGDAEFKIILLDEADSLTKDAQQALRRTMENYSSICRFILDCNYSSNLIEPIQSRCVVFRFKPLSEEDVKMYLARIAKGEKLTLDEAASNAIFEECGGDLRKSTNILQACAAIDAKITEDIVLEVVGRAKNSDIEELLKLALDKKFLKAREKLYKLTLEQGISSDYLLKQIYQQIFKLDLPEDSKVQIIKMIAECDFRIVEGSNPTIQMEAFLAGLGEK